MNIRLIYKTVAILVIWVASVYVVAFDVCEPPVLVASVISSLMIIFLKLGNDER